MFTSGQTVSNVAVLATAFEQCCSGQVCATGVVGGDVGKGVGEVVGGAVVGAFVGLAVGWGVNPRKKGALA